MDHHHAAVDLAREGPLGRGVAAARVGDSSAPRRALLALARTEGWRLVRHPAMLAGAGLSVLFLIGSLFAEGPDSPGAEYTALTGLGLIPLGVGTFVAANFAAIRSRRDRTDELYGSAVVSETRRTVAHLLSLAWPVTLASLLLIGALVYHRAWDGLLVEFPTGREHVAPGIALAQGPLFVLVLGCLGVVMARWIPTRLLALPLLLAIFVQMIGVTWDVEGPGAWFAPLVSGMQRGEWVETAPDGSGYSQVLGFQTVAMRWHLLYVATLVVLIVAGAIAKTARGARVRRILVAAAAAAAAAGTLQVLTLE